METWVIKEPPCVGGAWRAGGEAVVVAKSSAEPRLTAAPGVSPGELLDAPAAA